jgi:hypothetical protein
MPSELSSAKEKWVGLSHSLASDSSSQLQVLQHHSHPVSMNRAELGIAEQAYQVALSCFLHSKESLGWESDVRVLRPRNLSDNSLEGQSRDEKVTAKL